MEQFIKKVGDILDKFIPGSWSINVDEKINPDVAIIALKDGNLVCIRYLLKAKYERMLFMEDHLTEEIKEWHEIFHL